MKIINSKNLQEKIRQFVRDKVQEIFQITSLTNPEKELEDELRYFLKSIDLPYFYFSVMHGFTPKGEAVKVLINYGTPIKQLRVKVEL